jgi:hypothetical protein
MAPEDQGVKLLEKLLPNEWLKKRQIDRTELRNALFEAASLTFRLIVAPAETTCSSWARNKMVYVKPDQLKKVNGLPLATLLAESGSSELPSVVGFHIVDSEIGRYSQIWIPPDRPCPQSPQSSTKNKDWWTDYPSLWQPVYKQFLHPSTSLINAYKRGLLKFPDGDSLLIHWGDSAVDGFKNDKTKIVSLRSSDDALQQFLHQTEKVLCEFHKVLLEYCSPDLSNKSEQVVVEEIGNELKNGEAKIIEMLKLIRERYFFAVLEPGDDRKKFMSILEKLSTTEGTIPFRLGKNKKIWLGTDRHTAMEGIEILQTILFNAPGFCSDRGLLIDHERYDNADVYLILGRDENYTPTFERCDQIKRIFQKHIALGFQAILKKKSRSSSCMNAAEPNPIVKEIFKYIKKPPDVVVDGTNRFATFALKLSREAIHEGRNLAFLLGCGHAEEPEVRCRKPIPIPHHLSREDVDLDLLVHFVKSYFNIFGQDDNLLWFDQKGRCCGLYERAPQDLKENWLDGWDTNTYFVRITGKDKFDFLEAETTVFPQGRQRPRVRIEGDHVVDLKSPSDIQSRAFVAAAQVFNPNANRAHWVSELVAKVADRLRENSHGAGLVIVNMEQHATNSGEWRNSIKEQEKSLVPKLHDNEHAEGENIRFINNPCPIDVFVDRICSFAELDGAVYLSFKGDDVRLAPARHFFPLITAGDGKKMTQNNFPNRVLQNFHMWSEEGCNIAQETQVAKRLHDFLEQWVAKTRDIGSLKLSPKTLKEEFNRYKNMEVFNGDIKLLKLYAAYIRGLIKLESDSAIWKACNQLVFLNSSGTRHHSLWGITLSSKERLFAVSLSQDGQVSMFWDGRLIPSHDEIKI